MKRVITSGAAVLVVALAASFLWSHFRQSSIHGLWSASSGASVHFSHGAVMIHPPLVAAGGSRAAPTATSGTYKIG